MPDSSTSMKIMYSRTCFVTDHEPRMATGVMKVVSSTRKSEMPSRPRW